MKIRQALNKKIIMRKIMKKVVFSSFALMILFFVLSSTSTRAHDTPIATDSRIKTFVYSENEVFPIVLHYGYQMSIEFGAGEVIKTYSVGNSYVWQITSMDSTLFIKPLEDNILTNMIVITNKRRYYFELQSKIASGAFDEELAYAVRFFYPDDKSDSLPKEGEAIDKKNYINMDSTIRPYNFNYSISNKGNKELSPTAVFDDGESTYFQYENGLNFMPQIVLSDDKKPLEIKKIGNYLIVNKIGNSFDIIYKKEKVNVKASIVENK